jgi:MoaA/NifB/PqqE/SkfB family radical SAM enzyme
MSTFNIEDHLAFRDQRYKKLDKSNPKLLGLSVVEINPTELCNRTCSFCPRSDPEIYPNSNFNMTVETVKILKDQLASAGYRGDVHITGYGEPLLNNDILEIISVLSKSFHTELITNGDRLVKGAITHKQLKFSGLNLLIVDCYDGPNHVKTMYELLKNCNIPFRIRDHHDDGTEKLIGLYNFNNRGGIFSPKETFRPCWLPFYKAFVDWNGNVGLCCNDWARKQKSFGNIHKRSFDEIWMSDEFSLVRSKLEKGLRKQLPACQNCDTNGTMQGYESVAVWQDRM